MEPLKHLEGLISGKINLFKTLFALIKLEAELARLSVYPLILNICFLFVVLVTLWSSIMLFIGYFTLSLVSNPLIAIGLIIFINLILFVGLLSYLSFNLKNISFAKTRAYFNQKEKSNDKIEKAINSSNSASGKKITLSTK